MPRSLFPLAFVSIALALLSGYASPASATRAELSARSLPPLMALDESNLRIFPGTASDLQPLVLADIYPGASANSSGLILMGGDTKWGYVLDGREHNLLFGNTHFGVIAGITEDSQKREIEYDENSESDFIFRRWDRRFRVGVGLTAKAPERTTSFGLGAARREQGFRYESPDIEGELPRLEKDGLGFDFSLQSIPAESGFVLGIGAAFEELDTDAPAPLTVRNRSAELGLGFRHKIEMLDDLVGGVRAAWFSYETILEQAPTDVRTSSGAILAPFLSAEKLVSRHVRLLGGISTGGEWREDKFSNDSQSTEERTDFRLNSPAATLGVAGTWRSVEAVVYLGSTVNLDSPIVRWSVVVPL
jgi:hypothetical protein